MLCLIIFSWGEAVQPKIYSPSCLERWILCTLGLHLNRVKRVLPLSLCKRTSFKSSRQEFD
jgi:hypothetical protein